MTNPVYDPATGTPVTITNATAPGQALSSASSPVVLASDQSAVPIKSGFTELSGLSAGALNADLLPSTDVSAYKWFSCQVTGTWVGTLTVQISNDNINFNSYLVHRIVAGTIISTTGGNDILEAAIVTRFLRIRMTSYTSGTAGGVAEFYTSPVPFLVSQVQPSSVVNTTPWLVSGSNNNAVQAANTAGNVVVKGSAGLLVGAIVTATGTVGLTVFDNASTNAGTQLLVIPANPTVGQLFPVNGWAKLGIVSAGVTNCPGVTFFYA